MKKILCAGIFLYWLLPQLSAQDIIRGQVSELNESGKPVPLPFANLHWLDTQEGTTADENGNFSLRKPVSGSTRLIVSFVGYRNDTLELSPGETTVKIALKKGTELGSVEVKERLAGSYVSVIQPIKTEVITTAGLQQLACCSLSGSFENSATVDVGFSDAVTGARQIQMLGLAGVYSQLMVENIPFSRGLGSMFGLSYIPGTWMESIQVSKGTSSVINGYESVTGQINVEFKKPWNSEAFFLNLYAGDEGRLEMNAAASHEFPGEKLSTLILAHASAQLGRIDMNHDGFLDQPLSRQFNISNRWSYKKEGKTESKFGINLLIDQRDGGQLTGMNTDEAIAGGRYVIKANTRRAQIYDKTGFVIHSIPNTSLGLIFSGLIHEQASLFGRSDYNATQRGLYMNAIFQSQIGSPAHTYNAGISMMYDNYSEAFRDTSFSRIESVPGVFAQYTFSPGSRLSLIAGLRFDYHNRYGAILTPRFHFKVDLSENAVLRGSVGKGYRSASILAENPGMLASSRQLVFSGDFRMEEAVNYGLNLTRTFTLNKKRSLILAADFYRTDFINQVIIDPDQAYDRIVIYNLHGQSFSTSFQVNADLTLFTGFEISAAYRLNDVQATTADQLRERPLVSKHKGLLTLSYETRFAKWRFDMTCQYNGRTRLPLGVPGLQEAGYGDYSPDYITIHSQVTRKFKKWDLYGGVENLTNFVQHDPVLGYQQPFDEGFDAGIVWGPLLGRMFYAGIRYSVR